MTKKRLDYPFAIWIIRHVIEFWWLYLLALSALYGLHYFQSQLPGLSKELGDQIINKRLGNAQIKSFIMIAFLIFLFRTCSRWFFFLPARIQQKNLRLELIEYLQNAVPRNYEGYSQGQLYQVLFNDFNRLRGFIGFALLQVGNIIIASFVLLPKINAVDDSLLIVFSPMFISIVLFSIIIFIFQPKLKKAIDSQGEVQNTIIEAFEAKETILNYQKEKDFITQFKDKSLTELNGFYIASLGPVLARPLIPLGLSISLIWGAIKLQANGFEVTTLIMFSGFLFLVLEPLMFLSWIGVISSESVASWGRIKKLLSSLKHTRDNSKHESSSQKDLYFIDFWEEEISFSQIKGSVLGLCGATGSGKSHCLLSIADQLKNKDFKVSFVMQEPHLFDDTIINNITLGHDLDQLKKDKVIDLLKIFRLNDLAGSIDEVLNLEVGENGKRLSGGQIKRLALIRSLFLNPDYLIWDDPFSSVDLISENEIMNNLKEKGYFDNLQLILSSHRVSTFKYVGCLVFLEKKKWPLEFRIKDGNIPAGKVNDFFKYQMADLSKV